MQRFWPAPALGVWLLAWVLSRTLHDSAAPWWAVLGLPALLGLVLLMLIVAAIARSG